MAVSELGALLKNKREELGLTLAEAEHQTRIRQRYIEALEAGAWDALPPGVYTRGLLKSYAKALGLSVNSVLRSYATERPQEARLPEPQLISQPLVRQPRISNEMLLAVAGFAIAGVLLAWLVMAELAPLIADARDRIDNLADGAPPAAATATNEPTAVAVSTVAGAPEGGEATAVDVATRATTSTPAPSPSPISGLVVLVEASNDVWFRVVADDEEIDSGFLRPGDSRVFEGSRYIALRTGNAGDTSVTVNGESLGILGVGAEVKDCQWILREPGVIEMTGCEIPSQVGAVGAGTPGAELPDAAGTSASASGAEPTSRPASATPAPSLTPAGTG